MLLQDVEVPQAQTNRSLPRANARALAGQEGAAHDVRWAAGRCDCCRAQGEPAALSSCKTALTCAPQRHITAEVASQMQWLIGTLIGAWIAAIFAQFAHNTTPPAGPRFANTVSAFVDTLSSLVATGQLLQSAKVPGGLCRWRASS
jgi:hypothetical protein